MHTPTPWILSKNAEHVRNPETGALIASAYGMGDESVKRANAARIVACVNACEGLNPEHIQTLIRAVVEAIAKCSYGTGEGAVDAELILHNAIDKIHAVKPKEASTATSKGI